MLSDKKSELGQYPKLSRAPLCVNSRETKSANLKESSLLQNQNGLNFKVQVMIEQRSHENNLLATEEDFQFQEYSTIASCSISPNSPTQDTSKQLLNSSEENTSPAKDKSDFS